MKKKIRKQIGYKIDCDKCGKNSIRVSEIKEIYLCSSCEKKEDKNYGKCECCKCEGQLHNSKCFICIDIKEANKIYKILKSIDWSAQPNLFKLARSVLLEDWEDSGIFMLKVVKKDLKDEDWEEYIWSLQLETWPLFFEFKNTDIFKKNYKKIFKKDFILDV